MRALQKYTKHIGAWASKDWVQWLAATIVFFLLSWVYMGNAITNCSTATTALGSDSTGGMVWNQWAGGNDLSWEYTDKSNYPFGENPEKPLLVTATVFIYIFKVLAALTTPICGLNLMVLLGYMSTGLVMFGLIKWLLKRFDIALFAGFAAAFVPYHTIKAQSHVSYIYGSFFVAIIWAYLWFLSRPSYKRAAVLALACAPGYYFDGYYILISSLLIGTLFASSFVYDLFAVILKRRAATPTFNMAKTRLKYLAVTVGLLALMLLPILAVYKDSGKDIEKTLATVRSDIKVETVTYGTRPIEFILPSYNSAFAPDNYIDWRNTKIHGSNFSEVNQYMGLTVIFLALVGTFYAFGRKHRREKLQSLAYRHVVFAVWLAFLVSFMFSLPWKVYILGHHILTPTAVLVKLTASWRVLSRLFLAMDPLVIIMASLGLYLLTKNLSRRIKVVVVAACGIALFFEYLPAQVGYTSDLYKNTPPIYSQLQKDKQAKLVAEYPLADLRYTPEIFTFQPVHNKTLLNANDGSISRGPFAASIAGLNDPQTLGALKQMNVDIVITHSFISDNSGLTARHNYKDNRMDPPPMSAYSINSSVTSLPYILSIQKGYESLSVDEDQISHRAVTGEATMRVLKLGKVAPADRYGISFKANSLCPAINANLSIMQDGRTVWSGLAGKTPVPVDIVVSGKDFYVTTKNCSIDVTEMSATAF